MLLLSCQGRLPADQCLLLSVRKHLVSHILLPLHLVWFLRSPADAISFLKKIMPSLLLQCGQQESVLAQALPIVQEKRDDILSSSLALDKLHTLHDEHPANSSIAVLDKGV